VHATKAYQVSYAQKDYKDFKWRCA